jgi:predicted nuclease of predicted toxin-antitoxin system
MRILFDQGTPVPLRRSLTRHGVETAYERRWSRLHNGELLDAAEQAGFEVLVTTDLNLKHQQNLCDRTIAVVALTTPSWPRIEKVSEAVARAIDGIAAGSYLEVEIP